MQNKCLFSTLLLGGASFLWGSVALANTPLLEPRPALIIKESVKELLELDTSRALEAERRKALGLGPEIPSVGGSAFISGEEPVTPPDPVVEEPVIVEPEIIVPKAPELKLMAIYGVDASIRADVAIDGTMVTFSAGRSMPVIGKAGGWRLKRITTPCVDLNSPEGKATRLCSYDSKKTAASAVEADS